MISRVSVVHCRVLSALCVGTCFVLCRRVAVFVCVVLCLGLVVVHVLGCTFVVCCVFCVFIVFVTCLYD